jgi:hypothetical protein
MEANIDQAIDPDLADFLESPTTLVLATRGVAAPPTVARGVGLRLSPDRAVIDVFVSRAQWPRALEGLQAGSPVALTACSPGTYRTYQIKGRLAEMARADAEGHELAERYRSDIGKVLVGLGVEARLAAHWLTTDDLVRLRLIPVTVFLQTPGPKAGAARMPGVEAGA